MNIGKKIQAARKSKGLTQKQLAERIGVATGTIQQYELGKRQPKLETLDKIAKSLDVSIFDILPSYEGGFEEEYEKMVKKLRKKYFPYSISISDDFEPSEEDIIESLRMSEPDFFENADQNYLELVSAFDELNAVGRQEAVKRVQELGEIPKYQKKDEPAQK